MGKLAKVRKTSSLPFLLPDPTSLSNIGIKYLLIQSESNFTNPVCMREKKGEDMFLKMSYNIDMNKNKPIRPVSDRFRASGRQMEYIRKHERINERKNRQSNKRSN